MFQLLQNVKLSLSLDIYTSYSNIAENDDML